MAAHLNTPTTIEQRGVVRLLWAKVMAAKDIHKKCCPCTVNIACHVKQSSKTTSFGGTLSWQWRGGKSSVRGSDSNHKNFRPQVSRDLWNGGTSVRICLEITLKNKCCLYVIIAIHFFSITICNLLIDFLSYMQSWHIQQWIWKGVPENGHFLIWEYISESVWKD